MKNKWKKNESASIPPSNEEIEVKLSDGTETTAVLEDGIAFKNTKTNRFIMIDVDWWRKLIKK